MSTPLRKRMRQDLQLAGLSERTQEAYLRAVRQLAVFYHMSPERVTEEQLREYFLYLKNEKRLSSQKIAYCRRPGGPLARKAGSASFSRTRSNGTGTR